MKQYILNYFDFLQKLHKKVSFKFAFKFSKQTKHIQFEHFSQASQSGCLPYLLNLQSHLQHLKGCLELFFSRYTFSYTVILYLAVIHSASFLVTFFLFVFLKLT